MQDPPVLLNTHLKLYPGPGVLTFVNKEEKSIYSLRNPEDLPELRESVVRSLEGLRVLSEQFEREVEKFLGKEEEKGKETDGMWGLD